MLKDFQLSGLHTNYTPERKSKQCFQQVHDVFQKQQTFDARAGGTKIEAGEERRDQAVMEAVLRLSSNVLLLHQPLLLHDFRFKTDQREQVRQRVQCGANRSLNILEREEGIAPSKKERRRHACKESSF